MRSLTVALSIAAAAAAGAVLHADAQDRKPTSLTVTGCLAKEAPRPTATSGTTGSSAGEARFILTSPNGENNAATGPVGATPKVVYRIAAADAAKVSGHDGEKVEITGSLSDDPASAQADRDTRTGMTDRAPELTVQSIKTVSAHCSAR